MTQFLAKIRNGNNSGSLILTLPANIVSCFDVHEGDFVEMEFIKNKRDGKIERR